MNKNILPRLEGRALTWVFCEMKSGLIFCACTYDDEGAPVVIEKLKWEEAYHIETRYEFNFDNSAVEFIKEWTDTKRLGKGLIHVKDKYSVMSQKNWNKLKKLPAEKDTQLKTV